MDVDTLLRHRHQKFRILGGIVEGQPVDPEKKCNMKKKETNLSQATADIEAEIENIKKAALEGKIPAPTISDEAVEKLRQEVDKEMTNAFISMGLQEKLEALWMELSKSSNSPDQTLGPILKEKVDRLTQEFVHNLSRPGSYMTLKQKLEMLEVCKLQEKRLKGEKLKEELNEKFREKVKDKIEIFRKARERVEKGEDLEEEVIKEIAKFKEEIEETLKSMNLEVDCLMVGFSKEKEPTTLQVLQKKLKKAYEVITSEREKAIDKRGLRGKIEELKAEISSGLNKEKVEQLDEEIRKEIAAGVDLGELKRKIETAIKEENDGSSADVPQQETVGAGKASR